MRQSSDDSKERTWNEANEFCKNLRLAEYSDWRLPTLEEFASLIDKRRRPTISSVFKCQKGWYWSNIKPPQFSLWGAGLPKDVNFLNGTINKEYTHYRQIEYVRAVRNIR